MTIRSWSLEKNEHRCFAAKTNFSYLMEVWIVLPRNCHLFLLKQCYIPMLAFEYSSVWGHCLSRSGAEFSYWNWGYTTIQYSYHTQPCKHKMTGNIGIERAMKTRKKIHILLIMLQWQIFFLPRNIVMVFRHTHRSLSIRKKHIYNVMFKEKSAFLLFLESKSGGHLLLLYLVMSALLFEL